MNYNLIAYAQDFVSFLFEHLKEDSDKIKQVILFGSVARGEDNKKSDVDLFLDIIDEKVEAKIENILEKFYNSVKVKRYWNLLGIKNEINCSIGKLEEWADLQKSLIANGIVLFGKYKGKAETESFYLFIVTPSSNRNNNLSTWRALYGYNQKVGKKNYEVKGLVRDYNGEKLARGVFIIPSEHVLKISSFLKQSKFKFKMIGFEREK